jgi:hypothetical protein
MSEIRIRCPETGSEISTGIECDGVTFGQLPFIISQVECPLCGKQHSWSKSEAWLTDDTGSVTPRNAARSTPPV